MNNLLSYLWPQIRSMESEYNGILELTLINGRKVLNSKNANYSFGSLQRILEIGLSEIKLKNMSSVLLLGLGGGSVVYSLRKKHNYQGLIHAIEIDKKVIEIADKEFSITSSENLIINHQDAFDFVKITEHQYDLIIVDLFIDNKVPDQFYTEDFCINLSTLMKKNSTILFNLGMGLINIEKRKAVSNYFKQELKLETLQLDNILNTNSLLIIKKPSK